MAPRAAARGKTPCSPIAAGSPIHRQPNAMKTVRPVSLAGMRIALGVAAVMQGAPAGLRRLRSALLATLLVLLAACGAEPDDPLTHAVEVTPAAPVIARGTTLQLAATARRTDGTTRPVTGPELSKKLWPGERPPSGRQTFRNPHPACRLDRHTRGKCRSQRRAGAPAQTNVPSKVEAVARRLDLACRAPIGARRQRPFDATNGQQCDARPTRMVCAFSTSAERAHEQKLAGASNPKSNPPPMHLLFLLRKLTIFASLTATAAAQT
jgi:hypothetical protein